MARKETLNRNPNKMNSITKSLSALAIGGILSGTAFAGPNDAYASYTASIAMAQARTEKKAEYVTIAPFRPKVTPAGEKAKVEKTPTPKAK
jgi:hypothetical protein